MRNERGFTLIELLVVIAILVRAFWANRTGTQWCWG